MFRSSSRQLAARPVRARVLALAAGMLYLVSLLPVAAATPLAAPRALGSTPSSVNLVGDLQSEASGGACGDWDPACAGSAFTNAAGQVWTFTSATIPAGSWLYKVALGSWAENYGGDFKQDGPEIPLNLAAPQAVTFYYDNATHYIADSVRNTIYTVPGSFNSELGCATDWAPECLATMLTDVDGDGVFTTKLTLPSGSYEFKVATNESWSNPNYGDGGGSANIPFTVPGAGAVVTFSFDTATNVPSVDVKGLGPSLDNNVEWDGLRHDSRDTRYRTPGGAVAEGTPVTIRFRTFHDDVTSVKLRVYDLNASAQKVIAMKVAAADVPCAQAGLEDARCDFWEATLANAAANNLWYRFIVADGTDTDYYADDTSALDGGLGAASDDPVDNSYALMVQEPGTTVASWAKDAVMYQIFPDRFRNGRSNNDAQTGDVRYDDPVVRLGWGILPEGYCRNYADGATNCPWRFDLTPPDDSPTKEQPRGRDYFGGDLMGVRQQLDYIKALGVNTIYFNPIFDAGSNHGYDTQDYTRIDPYFGTQKDWETLVKQAKDRGIRIILDGVFNHMSSDSPTFDRYGHYPQVGACESVTSPYRSWFIFHDVAAGDGECAGTAGPNSATYDGWFGFDSIPVINKSQASVQAYFLTDTNSITKRWLRAGAAGWRLDVSGDPSFPNGYWETFRAQVRATSPDALTISETWQKDSTLLRMIRGDRLDTTMNYRLRDAVIGFLAPGSFDSKGFGDSGRIITPAEFLGRLSSIREDYPDTAYYSLMNLLDSHDTERLLWTLTPGAETTADKEQNATNVAAGKARVRLASLIQFTVPGAPTVYYGDEVGVTGDDDPDDRRTYPWADLGGTPDTAMLAHYTSLAALRRDLPVLRDGDFRALPLADSNVAAYGRRTTSQAAIVVVNRGSAPADVQVPVAGYLRDGLSFTTRLAIGTGGSAAAASSGGSIAVTVPANGALVLATGTVDLAPTTAPTGLTVTAERSREVDISWNAVAGAASYDVWVSDVSGGGYEQRNTSPVTGTTYTIGDLVNGRPYYVVVTATDGAGNPSAYSNEVKAQPQYVIGWANLQWPPTLDHTISAINRTDNVYGQVWIDGVTNQPGATVGLRAQAGYGPVGSDPASSAWTWVEAAFNQNVGNNDEFMATFLPETVGSFDYVYRYSTSGGAAWLYADLNGPVPAHQLPPNPGRLTVVASGDTTAPAVPTGLHVVSASPAGIELAWDAVAGDPTLYGYEVLRGDAAGGPYDLLGLTTTPSFTDMNVTEGQGYWYVVRSVDLSFNRSGISGEVLGTAELRTVTLQFTVTVPASTDGTGRSVYIAGFLDRLDGGHPQWDAGGVVMTRQDATHWTWTETGKEGTQLEYKYALGSWDYVEKDASCVEIANRQLTLAYGTSGVQTVNDTVLNWRNVPPCGN